MSDNQLSNQLDSLNVNIKNISYTLNGYINEAQNSRQLKLQSIELYELNYIINYIKVNYPKKMFQTRFLSKTNKQLLISQGYVVDYDSQNDTNTIKW
jgi:vacuolar-type H+-ATPase subunit I/STV1